jgi:hypothetical protein
MIQRAKLFYLLLAILILSLNSCQEKQIRDIDPKSYLTEEKQKSFLYSIARYHIKLPGKANHKTKFESRFDEEYRMISNKHELIYYFIDQDSQQIYFMTYRIAPSIHVKKVATAGIVSFDENGQIIHYEEKFRTWRLPLDELEKKSTMLFQLMLDQKDLSKYYSHNSGEEEYIEFPDEYTYFDIEKRRWISKLENPREEYYNIEGSDSQQQQDTVPKE